MIGSRSRAVATSRRSASSESRWRPIPDEAFTPIEGDAKARAAILKKENKKERIEYAKGQGYLFAPYFKLGNLAADFARLNTSPDGTLAEVAALQDQYTQLVRSSEYESTRLLADTWCAAFVWKKDDSELGKLCPTERDFRKVESHAAVGLLPHVREEVEGLRDKYQFFHWHLAFPDVFRLPGKDETPQNEQSGWSGGFDAVLGNPPWEHTELKEKEWFAERRADIANARTSAERKRMIQALQTEDPSLFIQFNNALRQQDGISHFLGSSGAFPLCGRGRINLYAVFAESMKQRINPCGRLGCIVPSEIATSDTTKFYFQDLVQSRMLASVYSFENEEFLFASVHHATKFCLLTVTGVGRPTDKADFIFYARQVSHLSDQTRHFSLDAERIALLNPNTFTCPVFRSGRDAELTTAIYSRVSAFVREGQSEGNPWGLEIRRIFNMGIPEVVELCLSAPAPEETQDVVPVFEAKLMHQYDHRFASYGADEVEEVLSEKKKDPYLAIHPRYWIPKVEIESRLGELWKHRWLLCWRDITNTTNEHTVIACAVPFVGTDFTLRVGFPSASSPEYAALFLANLNSLSFEYSARQSLGGTHLSDYIFKQLPGLTPRSYSQLIPCSDGSQTFRDWLLPRVLELTYTAWDLEPFAQDCGYTGPPFCWDEERRFLLRAELDAAFFHLYGISRDDSAYILDTFPIVRRKDEQKYNGEFKTKTTILEIYDAIAESIRTGQPYQTRLDPPPADPRVAHPDTRQAVVVSEEQLVRSGRIAAYVVLLLHEWNRPAARNVLEAALVLMLNDRVRQQLLNQATETRPPSSLRGSTEFVRGFDGFLAQLETTGFVAIKTIRGTQSIQLGTRVPATATAPDDDRMRLQESLKALEIIGEDRARDVLQAMVTESYAVVS